MALEREFYSAEELAELLGVNQHTLYREVKRGALVGHKIGRILRFRRDDIEAYLLAVRGNPITKEPQE